MDGRLANQTTEYTNELGIANSAARILPAGTVVMSRTASVGFVTIMGRPMATSQDFVNWVCGPGLVPEFLAFLLRASRWYVRFLGSGAVHKTVYFPTVKSFHVCVPDRFEQERIVRLLTEQLGLAERARSAAEARLEASRALPAARARQLFKGDESRTWAVRELSQILIGTGQYGLSSKMSPEPIGLPVLRMGNLSPGRVDWSELRYVRLPALEAARYDLKKGDLLFNRTNSAALVGKTAVFPGDRKALFASYLIRFRVNPEVADPEFVCSYINSDEGREFVNRHMARAIGQVNISAAVMSRMPVPLPSLARQKEAVGELKQYELATQDLTKSAEEECSALKGFPGTLLRRAFCGHLDLEEGDGRKRP